MKVYFDIMENLIHSLNIKTTENININLNFAILMI